MSNKPDFIVWSVRDKGEGKDGYWHKIGSAWKTRTGDGFTIQLDSLPLDGRLTLLPPKAETEGQGGAA